MKFSDLCVELVEAIVDHLQTDRDSLRACTMTSNIFLARAQRHLFAHGSVSIDTLYHSYRRPDRVTALIMMRPQLAEAVSSVVVDGRPGNNLRVLKHLPYLRTLRIHGLVSGSGDATKAIAALRGTSCPLLAELTFSSCHLTTSHLSQLCLAFPSAARVILTATTWTTAPGDTWCPGVSIPAPHVRHLELSFRALEYHRLHEVDMLLLAGCFTPERLEVNMWDHMCLQIPGNCVSSLQRLLETPHIARALEHLVLTGFNEHGTLALAPLTALRSLTIKDFQNDDGFGFLPPSPSSGRTFASLLESAASPTLSRAEWHVGEAAVAVVERAEWAMVKEAVDVARRKLDKAGKIDMGMSSGAGASFKPRMGAPELKIKIGVQMGSIDVREAAGTAGLPDTPGSYSPRTASAFKWAERLLEEHNMQGVELVADVR